MDTTGASPGTLSVRLHPSSHMDRPSNEIPDQSPTRNSCQNGDLNEEALIEDASVDDDISPSSTSSMDARLPSIDADPAPSTASSPAAIHVVFSRDSVSIRPNQTTSISGRLSLVKQHGILFITWLPHPSHRSDPSAISSRGNNPQASLREGSTTTSPGQRIWSGSPFADHSAYALHPIPLSDVRSIKPHTPPLRQHTVTLVLHSGVTLPPFYFLQGGVKAFMSVLRQYAAVMPSSDDSATFLVNDLADPLTRSLNSLELSHVLPPHTGRQGGRGESHTTQGRDGFSWPLATWQVEETSEDSSDENIPSVRMQLRDLAGRVGRLTQGAREAASSILTGSVMVGGAPLAEHLAVIGRAAIAAAGGDEEQRHGQAIENGEYYNNGENSAPSPFSGRVNQQQRETGSPRGREESNREDHPGTGTGLVIQTATQTEPSSAANGNQEENIGDTIYNHKNNAAEDGVGSRPMSPTSAAMTGWELIERSVSCEETSLPSWARPRPPPLTLDELLSMEDSEGRLVASQMEVLRERAFTSGVDPGARPEVWKFLLGLHAVGSTRAERAEAVEGRLKRYLVLRRQWQSIGDEQAGKFSKWRERKTMVDKDVRRTDRSHPFFQHRGPAQTMLRRVLLTHVMWNFDLGYCQGMSDIASPLLWVARTALEGEDARQLTAQQQNEVEAEAFWMFAAVMDRMASNFSVDSNGMLAQLVVLRHLLGHLDPPLHAHLTRHDAISLFFCYRWILILFKREFKFDQVLRLWEALWARPGHQLHLYLAAAVLCRQRRHILEDDLDFDGLLELCVHLAGNIDLEMALADAEKLRLFAGEVGQALVGELPPLMG